MLFGFGDSRILVLIIIILGGFIFILEGEFLFGDKLRGDLIEGVF